jgi:dihydrofolate synthase/folylpolyglutamate synthase
MNYQETLAYMFNALPMYQRQGKAAFKKDLSNTLAFCKHLAHPERQFKSIHVAGTNGKGSTAHMIAAMLQQVGLKVGLYTSPHLKDFRERIRINGQMIDKEVVITFIDEHKDFIEQIQPSFFEMTVAMAFDVFAQAQVDIAVVEVGLGGRLDSTNVILPELSVITNIGFDHMELLGDTLPKIAGEKAGIIKEGVPVIIGTHQAETAPVFERIAKENNAPLYYATAICKPDDHNLKTDLKGSYQAANKLTAIAAMRLLAQKAFPHFDLVKALQGLAHVVKLTGLKGRWQQLNDKPTIYCDTGHNAEAFDYLLPSLQAIAHRKLYMVLGFVNDKKISGLLARLPKEAHYIFTQAKIPRAMTLAELEKEVAPFQLSASFIPDVNEALSEAKALAQEDDLIFVGGSTFVVAEIAEL